MLLESFNTIHKKINAKLILVGYGSEENSLKNFIQTNNLKNKVLLIKKPKIFIITTVLLICLY